MNLPSGYILQNGKYRLNHVVGQGGFGITYNAVWFTEVKGPLGTLKTEVPVCIKEYFFKDYCFRDPQTNAVQVHSETGNILFAKFKEKQIKEAKILSDVSHPYIVNVLEVFEENNTAYIVMEYISGCSLKYMMETKGVLSESKLLKYTRQIGEALVFVHQNNILHLDIKPSNILIDKNDNARLIDFGVSKRYDLESEETSTTMLTLSKGFAAIEQYDSEGTQLFSPCPDIYSLGATMYNLITGKAPVESILRATRPLIRPSEFNPAISPKTEDAILKAMEIVPQNRFQSAKEMLDALDIPVEDTQDSNDLQQTFPESGEETVLLPVDENYSKQVKPSAHKKKKTWIAGTSVLVALSAIIVSAVFFIVQHNSAQEGLINQQREDDFNNAEPKEVLNTESVEEELPANSQQELTVPAKEDVAEPVITKKNENTEVKEQEVIVAELPNESELEANYNQLIASGKEKMNIFDFEGARKDFSEAKAIRLTEEVVRLLISCDTNEAERQIALKMESYEFKMDFGGLKIVTNKNTKRYGAINDKAEEIIPCKYITVGRSANGRAFEREDHLFDIYNENGELLGNGLTYY